MTKRSAVVGLAGWIGKGSGAIVVMVVRPDDTVFWVDPRCTPEDASDLVQGLLGDMVAETNAERRQAREDAAVKAQRKQERQSRR